MNDIYLENTYMDKCKTTKILSGGGRIGKDGKPHKWSKIHGYKTQKITDDNWMDYGMPDDEPVTRKIKNESRHMNKKLIRLTESDLHRIVKESVEKILSESDYDNFFDWANNSSASPEEIEAASQRHDSRIPSIKSPTDKLARRERTFSRRASMNDPDIGERIANRKDFIKNQRQGEDFRKRITR